MSKKKITDAFKIRNTTIRNRICLPPIVCFSYNKSEEGMSSRENIDHYQAIARGGAGLIIQEATCVNPNGKLGETQLGLWDDKHVDGLKKITQAVHEEGSHIIVQIHHAGIVGIEKNAMCPSAYTLTDKEGNKKIGKEMTLEEIHTIQQDFIRAAIRASKAGFDGVELHGCHNYLICQFLNAKVNVRKDQYGTNPISFVTEIMEGIRKETPDDFIIGIRLGGFEPTLEDSIRHAKELEAKGIDFIDVSYGFSWESNPYAPDDFQHKDIIFSASEIKKNVSVPVFAVYGIRTPEQAKAILEDTNVDMVDVGRSFVIDKEWANKAIEGKTPGKCIGCKVCVWGRTPEQCPGVRLLQVPTK